jgi:hypothetical protein
MASVYPNGFSLLKGPRETFMSVISSTATFVKGQPLTYSDDRTLLEAVSDTTAVVGVAMHDAADTLPGPYAGVALVQKVLPGQTWVCQAGNPHVTSGLSAGQTLGLEKSGNYSVASSTGTRHVVIVPRDDGSTTVDSADSSIFVEFLGDVRGLHASNASVNIFAQD